MRRHLTLSEAQSVLNRGKQIEQFLGGLVCEEYKDYRKAKNS
jgi:hypothetical protein